ncbi:ATP-binding cassette domain-containing protein [Corynebacterium phocae]|uniref:ATP-binding cassette domain-containing protein n=1 Tax=Corynebacterium phocae TaxID=161895 RepID=UPI001FE4AC19|nr:ABC transporter ATP-binding protein [Corynebacterium phocae]
MPIELQALTVVRQGRCVLNIPHLEIGNRPTLLLGANGAGKSTLLSLISGRMKPTSGTISATDSIAFVEQQFKPIVGFTCAEYCAYVAWLFGQDRKAAAKNSLSCLEFTNLDHLANQRCENLSGGESSRLAIATALNTGATTLLLDEPSAALDTVNKQHITEIYRKIVDAGQNLVVSTHDSGELQEPFSRVIVLASGTIEFDGDRKEFLELADTEGNSAAQVLARSFRSRRQGYGS